MIGFRHDHKIAFSKGIIRRADDGFQIISFSAKEEGR